VILSDILPSTKAAFSFKIPDHKSGKVSKMQLTEMKLVKIMNKKYKRKKRMIISL